MSNGLIIFFIFAAFVFGILWKNGQLVRLKNYVGETREELKKCSWPTKEELKGSTLVVIISVAALAAFTVVVDFVVHNMVTFINR